MQQDDEAIQYRSPAQVGPGRIAPQKDDEDFSTLQDVEEVLGQEIENLYKDFNAFNLLEDEEGVKRQIEAKQIAYSILMPAYNQVKSAIESVKEERDS